MKFTIVLALISASIFQTFGQESKTKKVLMFIGRVDGHTIFLNEGKRFTAYWKDKENTIKHATGKLLIINQNTIQLGNEKIPINALTKAKVHVVGKKIAGGIIDIVGFGLIALGAKKSLDNFGDLEGGGLKGAPYVIMGAIVIGVSTPLLIVIPKTFNLTLGYRPVVKEISN